MRYFLVTARLGFRSWSDNDLELALGLWGDPAVTRLISREALTAQQVREIGAHIRAKHWRRGFAQEASRAVIGHAVGRLGAAALFAGHNPANESSRLLLGKLGFRHTHDELYPPTGLEHPCYLLRREEWRQ